MSRSRSQFVCQQCGFSSPKWLGRCPECQTWNSLVEESLPSSASTKGSRSLSTTVGTVAITDIQESAGGRIQLPMEELNRVLGGGLTPGSVILLAGDPGIGKSTLLLQLLGALSPQIDRPLLYVSGEESAPQIKQRAVRLKVLNPRIQVLPETNLSDILAVVEKLSPELIVVDSVQTLYWPELTSIPGSISQVREVADRIVRVAKQKDITVILVGHVTKDGGIAGPMALEHLVDTVLFFEGDRGQSYRILRAMKNRFGATDEIGVFDMHEDGLEEVRNPSEIFLRDRPQKTPGTVVFPAIEGTRPLLVEVQGLATKSSYGVPLRTSVGFDKNRLSMLLAVLEKRANLPFYDQDVYVNVVGGIRISEPAADLAVLSAVLSSYLGKTFPSLAVVFGEIGLAGEVRTVSRSENRLKEGLKLGFTSAVLPAKTSVNFSDMNPIRVRAVEDLVETLR